MQDTGVHVPNLVVGMTAEDALPHIFRGENCMEQFLQWLEQLTEQDTRYVTALAHNFKGYDSYFVVKRLIERKQKFKPTRTGGKLLELTYRGGYIRFIDSMSFFAMALASFTKTFGLDPDHFKRGIFHIFSTPLRTPTMWVPCHRERCTPLKPCPLKEKRSLSNGTRLKWRTRHSLISRGISWTTVSLTSNSSKRVV